MSSGSVVQHQPDPADGAVRADTLPRIDWRRLHASIDAALAAADETTPQGFLRSLARRKEDA